MKYNSTTTLTLPHKLKNLLSGENDALAVATTSNFHGMSVKSESSTSSFQLWQFGQSLTSSMVTEPTLVLSVNLPYVINAITQEWLKYPSLEVRLE